jgi:hypothetical protein
MTLYVNKSCPCLFCAEMMAALVRGPDRLEAQAAVQGREI